MSQQNHHNNSPQSRMHNPQTTQQAQSGHSALKSKTRKSKMIAVPILASISVLLVLGLMVFIGFRVLNSAPKPDQVSSAQRTLAPTEVAEPSPTREQEEVVASVPSSIPTHKQSPQHSPKPKPDSKKPKTGKGGLQEAYEACRSSLGSGLIFDDGDNSLTVVVKDSLTETEAGCVADTLGQPRSVFVKMQKTLSTYDPSVKKLDFHSTTFGRYKMKWSAAPNFSTGELTAALLVIYTYK